MNRLTFIAILLITWSCANRVAPTGGPRDEEPPLMVRSIPEDGQRNFKSQSVDLEFNEFINLKSFKEQLIITPRIDSEYEVKFKKRTVTIEFEEPFADSTTYTLNFRDGIVDITENQPAENLQVAFSTGSLLDTLEIYGSVMNLLTQEPIKDATVGLYTIDDTLNIFTGPPYYFAKTDEDGHYHFRNIKDGEYKLYAFTDNNKNLTCQSSNEAYAFQSQAIVLDTTIVADTLHMEYMNLDTLKLLRVRPSGKYFNVLSNKYLTDARLSSSNGKPLSYHYDEDHQGLVVYNTLSIQDSLLVYTHFKDSLEQVAIDSFYLKFPETTRRLEDFMVSLDEINGSESSKKITGKINFSKPLQEIRLDSIHIYKDSLSSFPLINNFNFSIDSLENTLEYSIQTPKPILDTLKLYKDKTRNRDKNKTEKSSKLPSYTLIIPHGSVYSIEQDTAEALQKNIKFIESTQTGVITGNINSQYNSYFIQLLDNRFKVVQQTTALNEYKFSEVTPGDYIIRILIDENQNGKWDHSDFRYNRMAEPVILYQDDSGNNRTAVRANWEISVDLSF